MPAKLYNGGWEGPTHFNFWAQYLDEDYDPDCDVQPARLYVAWLVWTKTKNLDTVVSCILNQWEFGDCFHAWDKCVEWVKAYDWASLSRFEDDAKDFLEKLRGEVDQLTQGSV